MNTKTEFEFSKPLLQELHLLTIDGKLNQDSRRKLKQIHHLNQFIIPLLKTMQDQDFTLVDVGAGKSYLGFLLYDQYIQSLPHGKVVGIESRSELVEKSKALAKTLNFKRMNFLAKNIQEVLKDLGSVQADIVTALHACDTATDDAIKLGVAKKAKFIVLIPCCQAEIASILKSNKPQLTKGPMLQLFRHALHTREFGSHLTNVLRCLYLEACGYQVTVTEFVGHEHSLKNELIIAKNIYQENKKSSDDFDQLIQQFKLESLNYKLR